MDIDIPMIEDKSDRFKENVAIIKDGDEYYYLLEDKDEISVYGGCIKSE